MRQRDTTIIVRSTGEVSTGSTVLPDAPFADRVRELTAATLGLLPADGGPVTRSLCGCALRWLWRVHGCGSCEPGASGWLGDVARRRVVSAVSAMTAEPVSTAAGIMRMLTIRDAIASVALSHSEHCDCVTCRASHGDAKALVQVLAEMAA